MNSSIVIKQLIKPFPITIEAAIIAFTIEFIITTAATTFIITIIGLKVIFLIIKSAIVVVAVAVKVKAIFLAMTNSAKSTLTFIFKNLHFSFFILANLKLIRAMRKVNSAFS